jgi:hypothetical protein
MTYPPQQPGSGGWDQQQPTGNVAPGTPQQQPGWQSNEQITWDQQPQQAGAPQLPPHAFPQFQPQAFPQHHAPQPPPTPHWAGEFGQGSWIQEPNGFGEVIAPAPKKSRMPWVLGAVGVLVLAGGAAAGLFFFLGGPGDPTPVAQDLISKVNANDFNAVRSQLCQANRPELETALNQLEGGRFDIQVGKVTENGQKAAVQLTGTYSLGETPQPVNQTMGLTVENGQWKLCELSG